MLRSVRSLRAYSTFKEGDVALARHVLRPDRPILSSPLTPGKHINTGTTKITHDEIIGQPIRTTLTTVPSAKQGPQKYILTKPTLEEFLVYRKRDAQPIYPLDAAAILSLADIHVDETGPVTQYLEAGTGHGSLTLAICKAIHAANGPARAAATAAAVAGAEVDPSAETPDLRKAILHSIDRNATHSRTGRHNVRDFRRGMYRQDVEFHVCDSPEEWLRDHSSPWRALASDSTTADSPETMFLHGAFLDLPSPDLSIETIAEYLTVDSPLVVFCPSITQIQDMVEHVRQAIEVDLTLVNTVELMPGMGGGSMRAWDVRSTVVRQTGEVVRVCRPRVGLNVVGGGFVAVFRKLPKGSRAKIAEMKNAEQQQQQLQQEDTVNTVNTE